MKNFLWFLHKPIDEREQLLYIEAYKRVLYFLLGIFVFGSIFTGIFGLGDKVFSAPVWFLDMCIDITFLVCIFLGWHVLHKEDLDSISQKVTRPQRITVIIAVLAFVLFLANVITYFFPQWYLLIYIVAFVVGWLSLGFFAWRSLSDTIPLLLRVYLLILYPLFVLVFSRLSSKINIRRFIGASITSLVLHFILFLVFALSFTFTSGMPYYIATDKFEPELQKGERVITRKNFDSLRVNDFVIFLGSTGKPEGGTRPTVGKVIQLTPDLLLDTNNGPVTVKKEELLGVVIKSEFNIGKDFFSFFGVTVTPDDIEEK